MIFPVKLLLKYILILTGFSFFITCAGYMILKALELNDAVRDLLILSAVFSLIATVSLLIYLRGHSKEPQSQTLHTLVSLSIKFLLELVLTIFWFIVAKKTSAESVLIFFVLYLAFSLFLILLILKTLKNKSL